MTDLSPAPAAAAPPPPLPWFELVLYGVGGYGVFALASLALGIYINLVAREITLGVSLALYVVNFLCLGGAMYFLGIRRGKFSWAGLGLWPPRWRWRWLLPVVGITLVLLPLRVGLAVLIQQLFGGGLEGLQARTQVFLPNTQFAWLDFGVTLLGVGGLAPISEELYFRGLLHGWCQTRYRFWARVLLSSTFFGLAHFDTSGVVISSFIMGVICAVAYERTRSLWLSIALHAFNNSLAVIVGYLALALS